MHLQLAAFFLCRKKGQVALEYLLIFSFSLLMVGIIWVYATVNVSGTKIDMQVNYAKQAVNEIAEVADMIYVQGPPAQIYIYPSFPDGAVNVMISENKIILQIRFDDIIANITAESAANLTGNLSTAPGRHTVLIKSMGNYVEISDGI